MDSRLFRRRLHQRLRKAVADSNRSEQERLLGQRDDVTAFAKAIGEIRSGESDVLAKLTPTRDPGSPSLSAYHVLRAATWQGYFWIDRSKSLCLGLLAYDKRTDASEDLAPTLARATQKLLAAIESQGDKK